jgi:hypothetical protein
MFPPGTGQRRPRRWTGGCRWPGFGPFNRLVQFSFKPPAVGGCCSAEQERTGKQDNGKKNAKTLFHDGTPPKISSVNKTFCRQNVILSETEKLKIDAHVHFMLPYIIRQRSP